MDAPFQVLTVGARRGGGAGPNPVAEYQDSESEFGNAECVMDGEDDDPAALFALAALSRAGAGRAAAAAGPAAATRTPRSLGRPTPAAV